MANTTNTDGLITSLPICYNQVLPLVFDDSITYLQMQAKIVRKLNEVIDFTKINSIKYADPLMWDITEQYEANTVVVDKSGNAYLSVQPVPAGIALERTDYWTKIGNFDVLWDNVKKGITPYDEKTSTTASGSRKSGDLVWLDNVLYLVTRNMQAGDRYVVGSNCEETSVSVRLNTIKDELNQAIDDLDNSLTAKVNAEASARSEADTAIRAELAAESKKRADDDTSIRADLATESATRAEADTAIKAALTAESTARADADSKLESEIDSVKKLVQDKYYIFQGDSYAGENGEWTALLPQIMGLSDDKYTIIADGGDGFSTKGLPQNLFWNTLVAQADKVPDKNAVTDVVVCGGRNDYYANSGDSIKTGMSTYYDTMHSLFPKAKLHIGFIGWDANTTEVSANKELWLSNACAAYIEWCGSNGVHYLSGVEYAMHNFDFFKEDGKHPNASGSRVIASAVFQALVYGSADVQYAYLGAAKTPAGICTDLGNYNFGERLDNGTVTLWPCQYEAYISITTDNMVLDNNHPMQIGVVNTRYVNGTEYGLMVFPIQSVVSTSDGKYYNVPGRLILNQRRLYYTGVYVENNSWLTLTNANHIRLFPVGPVAVDTMS
nr:MAG TPA: cell envelope integrity inner membrane protein [Caudoviricetes sp.]